MTKIYFTYRRAWTERGVCQDVSFYNDKQYADYVSAGLVEMVDGERFIPDSRFTKEVIPGVKMLRRAGYLQVNHSDLVEGAKANLDNITKQFDLQIKTTEEMLVRIRSHTDLEEVEAGKFEILEDLEGQKVYLNID